jgi:hypothetical protein
MELRPQLLKQLYVTHAGTNRSRELARKHFFLTGLTTDIAAMISDCDKCQYLRQS